jgi:hypothetical protein
VNLVADEAGAVGVASDPLGTFQVARAEVASSDVPYFSLPHEIVERAKCFFQRNERVAVVQLIEVDMIPVKTAEASFHRPHDMRAAKAYVVVTNAGAKPDFRGDEQTRFIEPEVT